MRRGTLYCGLADTSAAVLRVQMPCKVVQSAVCLCKAARTCLCHRVKRSHAFLSSRQDSSNVPQASRDDFVLAFRTCMLVGSCVVLYFFGAVRPGNFLKPGTGCMMGRGLVSFPSISAYPAYLRLLRLVQIINSIYTAWPLQSASMLRRLFTMPSFLSRCHMTPWTS